jgi:O-antigen ligase
MFARIPIALTALFVFSLGFMQPSLRTGRLKIEISDAVFVVAAAAIAVAIAARSLRFEATRYLYFAGLFLFAVAVSVVFSDDPATSLARFAGKAYLATVPLAILYTVRTEKDLRFVCCAWLAAVAVSVATAAASVVLFYADRGNPLLGYTLFHFGTLPPGNYPRIAATFVNANMFANYLNASATLAIAAYFGDVIGRVTATVLVGAILIAAAFTFSPGIGGFFILAGIAALTISRRSQSDGGGRWRMAAIPAFAAAAIFVAAASVSPSPQAVPTASFDLYGYRIEPSARALTWLGSAETFARHPFAGRGPGLEACRVSYRDLSGRDQTLTDAHNTYLNIAAESGLGALAALVGIAAFFASRIRAIDRRTRILAAGFIAVFVYQGITGSYEDARHLWALMGLIVASERLGTRPVLS